LSAGEFPELTNGLGIEISGDPFGWHMPDPI